MYVPKTRASVPTVPLLPVLLVLPMVATFVLPVELDFTKMARLVLAADPALREQDKQQLVHRPPIVYVPKMYVPVPTVSKLWVPLVLHTTPTLVRPAPVNTTKMVTLAVDVILVPFIQDKQQLVHRPPIVYVLKMYVPVPTV